MKKVKNNNIGQQSNSIESSPLTELATRHLFGQEVLAIIERNSKKHKPFTLHHLFSEAIKATFKNIIDPSTCPIKEQNFDIKTAKKTLDELWSSITKMGFALEKYRVGDFCDEWFDGEHHSKFKRFLLENC